MDFLIVRAGAETAQEKLREKHARPFYITGKSMKGWFMVEERGWKTADDLKAWLLIGSFRPETSGCMGEIPMTRKTVR